MVGTQKPVFNAFVSAFASFVPCFYTICILPSHHLHPAFVPSIDTCCAQILYPLHPAFTDFTPMHRLCTLPSGHLHILPVVPFPPFTPTSHPVKSSPPDIGVFEGRNAKDTNGVEPGIINATQVFSQTEVNYNQLDLK